MSELDVERLRKALHAIRYSADERKMAHRIVTAYEADSGVEG